MNLCIKEIIEFLMRSSMMVMLATVSLACNPAPPSDPVDAGSICLPETSSCATQANVFRPFHGRNALDFSLTNRGPATQVEVVLLPSTQPEAALDVGHDIYEAGSTSPQFLKAATYHLAPEERKVDQFSSLDIGTLSEMVLELNCLAPPCEVVMEYVLLAQPLQCVDDGDCGRYRRCNVTAAHCVDCLSGADCAASQTCNVEQGICTPPMRTNCAVQNRHAITSSSIIWLLFFIAMATLWRLRRSIAYGNGRIVGLLAALFGSLLLFYPAFSSTAIAAPPSSSLSVGIGPRFLTGELSSQTRSGYGLVISQRLRMKHFGSVVQISTATIPTTTAAPPVLPGVQMIAFALGPRLHLPVSPIDAVFGVDYHRVGMSSNSLMRWSGPALSHHAWSVNAGIEFRWSNFTFLIDSSYQYIVEFPANLFAITMHIGIISS